MAICTKCGNEVDKDDRFCSNCGAPIEENHKNEVWSEIKQVVKGMAVNPVKTISNVSNVISEETSIILAGIIAVIYGVLILGIVKKITSSVTIFKYFNLSYKFPYVKMFFLTILLVAIGYLISLLLLSLMGIAVFKGKKDFAGIWKVVVVSLIPYFYANVIAIVSSVISINISSIFMNGGLIIVSICLYKGLKNVIKVKEDKIAFTVAISHVVIVASILFIGSKLIILLIKSTISPFGL